MPYGDVVALDGCSFAVAPGELCGFLGPNGAGKTTAMRCAIGVATRDAGEVRWRGRAVALEIRRGTGDMPEERGLYPKVRVVEQLVYLARLHGMPHHDAQARARALMERLGIGDRAAGGRQAAGGWTGAGSSTTVESMDIELSPLERRAACHHALGEPHRLAVVEALWAGDLTPSELGTVTGLPSNVLAFHLDVLEDTGFIARQASHGDRRRRYVTLRTPPPIELDVPPPADPGPVLFVCTRNAARSQLAAALWRRRTGGDAWSAGTHPAAAVDPAAIAVAADHGLDLSAATPRSYAEVTAHPALVVSVCDRVRESLPEVSAPTLHWSIPDPAPADQTDVDRAYRQLDVRVERLARQLAA